MRNEILYELLFKSYIYDYRKELEKETDEPFKLLQQARANLEKNLSAEHFKLVEDYEYYLNLREEDLNFNMGAKILNYGIKIGMELQKILSEDEN